MIYLIYSEFCNHCKILLETIKKHNNDSIKLVSVDNLRAKGVKLKVQHVPAILFKNTEKIIYGKDVFDYLLLPGQGILLKDNGNKDSSTNKNFDDIVDEPSGIHSHIDNNYESLENSNEIIGTSASQWEVINTNNNNVTPSFDIMDRSDEDKEHKKLPSMEDIMKKRELEIT